MLYRAFGVNKVGCQNGHQPFMTAKHPITKRWFQGCSVRESILKDRYRLNFYQSVSGCTWFSRESFLPNILC